MSISASKIGVITEQGFVAGNGLGFSIANEGEAKNIEESLKDKDKDTSK